MSEKTHILIVEDEPAIRTGLTDVFVYHGYEVTVAEDGEVGLALARTGKFALVLLDIMMPKLSGFEVCEAIRAADPNQPIIMLTARISDEDIVHGLRLGADDYVAKPFSVEQLVLRVAAVLRRANHHDSPEIPDEISLGNLTLDVRNLMAIRSGENQKVTFTKREMEVLTYLYANSDRPVPREEILANVWGYANHEMIETRTVDIHIAKIRKKIEKNPKEPSYLTTVRGAGYRLDHAE